MKNVCIPVMVAAATLLMSCNWQAKTNDVIGKSGEAVGKSAGEFFGGVGEGVEQTFDCEIVLSEELKQAGLKTGSFNVEDSGTTTSNVLALYFIFDKDFEGNIQARVFDSKKLEKGRVTAPVSGKAGAAGFTEFGFGNRTEIGRKNVIELSLVK